MNTLLTRATLNRYIAMRVLRSLAITFMVVTGIIMLVDFVEGSRNIGSDTDISSFKLAYLTLLKIPYLIEQTIPFVVLFGVMGALYGLNRRSELIVMRASGVSAWRFLLPVIFVTGTLGLIWSLLFNPLASQMMSHHELLSDDIGGQTQSDGGPVWLREGDSFMQTVIRADKIEDDTKVLMNPSFFQLTLDETGGAVFSRRFDARKARLITQGYWELTDVTENAPGEIKQARSTISLPTKITSKQLEGIGEKQTSPPFWALPSAIKTNERAGFSALALRMQFNKLLALPIMLIAMTFIAASVSMHLTRQGGTLRLLITGAAMGFGVYFADSMVSAFGEVALIPVALAAWSVPLFVLLSGISYLSKVEDG